MGEELDAVRFRVLGSLVVEGIDRQPRARKQRLLLGALLAEPARSVDRSVLCEVVWEGAPPPGALPGLQVLVARLRRALAPAGVALETTGSGYALDVAPPEVDHVRFTAADVPGASAHDLADALALWRGRPFGDLGDAPFLRGVTGQLTSVHERLTARLHDLRLAAGDAGPLLPALARWAQDRPLDEAAWCRYARALASVGRTAEALRTLHRLRRALADVAGLEPSPAVTALEQWLLSGATTVERPVTVAGPPLVSSELVGRHTEQHELRRLVGERRLVTIVGVGGIGKTRLALTLADRPGDVTGGELRWCDLAPLTDPDVVAAAICSACRLQRQPDASAAESLAAGIGERAVLLVLDNCEHVLGAARELVAALLQACPNLHVLATSRQPLDVTGEIVLRLGPLAALDDDGRPGPAVELFVQRARARGSRISPDPATTSSVIALCQRLDGLPLAVELAAARTTSLTPAEIGRRLGQDLDILRLPQPPIGGLPRHQTLRAAIAWSVELLEPAERRTFEDLAVFAGGFALEAAEHVCSPEPVAGPTVLATLASLVDRSLVVAQAEPDGTRYRLLDTIRAFAAEQLARRGDADVRRDRHARWYEALAVECGLGAATEDMPRWQELAERELPNLRVAFDHLVATGDVDGAQRLAAAAWVSVMSSPAAQVVGDWAATALGIAPDHVGPATATVRAAAAWRAVSLGWYDEAVGLADSALEAVAAGSDDDGRAANVAAVQSMFTRTGRERAASVAAREVLTARQAGDPERLVRALVHRYFTRSSRETQECLRDAVEAVERARLLGHPGLLGTALCHLAWLRHRLGDGGVEDLAVEAGVWSSLANDTVMYPYSLHLLSSTAREQGRLVEALDHAIAALECWRRSGDARIWPALHQVAALLADAGDPTTAVVLAGGIGDRNLGAQIHLRPEVLDDATHSLGEAAARGLRAVGRAKSPDELIALAVEAAGRVRAEAAP